MEAWSVEDNGEGVCFHVYVYNAQPGVVIDYATGENWEEGGERTYASAESYVLNTNSKKFHSEACTQAQDISAANKDTYTGTRESLLEQGYVPAGCCNP